MHITQSPQQHASHDGNFHTWLNLVTQDKGSYIVGGGGPIGRVQIRPRDILQYNSEEDEAKSCFLSWYSTTPELNPIHITILYNIHVVRLDAFDFSLQ